MQTTGRAWRAVKRRKRKRHRDAAQGTQERERHLRRSGGRSLPSEDILAAAGRFQEPSGTTTCWHYFKAPKDPPRK